MAPVRYPVCPEHEGLLTETLITMHHNRLGFGVMIGLTVVAALAPAFTDSTIGLAAPLVVLGAGMMLFPYATPLTVERSGFARSMRGIRFLGAAFLLFGAAFVLLAVL